MLSFIVLFTPVLPTVTCKRVVTKSSIDVSIVKSNSHNQNLYTSGSNLHSEESTSQYFYKLFDQKLAKLHFQHAPKARCNAEVFTAILLLQLKGEKGKYWIPKSD